MKTKQALGNSLLTPILFDDLSADLTLYIATPVVLAVAPVLDRYPLGHVASSAAHGFTATCVSFVLEAFPETESK